MNKRLGLPQYGISPTPRMSYPLDVTSVETESTLYDYTV